MSSTRGMVGSAVNQLEVAEREIQHRLRAQANLEALKERESNSTKKGKRMSNYIIFHHTPKE